MTVWLALSRAWRDLLRPGIFGLLLRGVGLTILLFVALQAGLFWALRRFVSGAFGLPLIGAVDIGNALSWGALLLFPILGFFLMAPVAAAFAGLYAETVAEKVEQLHYPDNVGHDVDFWDGMLASLPLMGAVLGVAILSLALTPVLGPLAPVLFYGANGWLLGREFFQMAARRHLGEAEATARRRALSASVTGAGVMIALLLTVPFLNVAVPVLAAATFTHLFQITDAPSRPRLRYPRG